MSTDDDAVRSGSENRRAVRRARARANRRKRPPLRQRVPGPGELVRQLGGGLRRRRRRIASLALAAGLLGAGYAAGRHLATSDRFAISGVKVSGAERVSAEELGEELAHLAGVNIFRANLARAEDRLAELPWIESARLRRDLPNRLEVQVSEREPAAVAHLGGLYLIDDEGEPFVRVSPGNEVTADLIAITGLDRETYARDPDAAHQALRDALAAAEAYADGDRPRLGEVHLGPGGELAFSTYEDAVAIHTDAAAGGDVAAWLQGYDAAWEALTERERATARLFRIQGAGAPERVTVAFSGIRAGN